MNKLTLISMVIGITLLAMGSAKADVAPLPVDVVAVAIDEDTIDNGLSAIELISFGPPFCGGVAPQGDPAVCVNDDIANPGVRALLPLGMGTFSLTLPTGQVGDEGIFLLADDPLVSAQNGAIVFLADYFSDITTPDENDLDKMERVIAAREAELESLIGNTVCAVVYDSDISVTGFEQASLKGATLGIIAFKVDGLVPMAGVLPHIQITIVDISVCDSLLEEPSQPPVRLVE